MCESHHFLIVLNSELKMHRNLAIFLWSVRGRIEYYLTSFFVGFFPFCLVD